MPSGSATPRCQRLSDTRASVESHLCTPDLQAYQAVRPNTEGHRVLQYGPICSNVGQLTIPAQAHYGRLRRSQTSKPGLTAYPEEQVTFLSRVVWAEGMYLGPHHFQLEGRY